MKSPARAHLSFTFYLILATLGLLCLYAAAVPTLSTPLSKLYLLSVGGYFGGEIFVACLVLFPTCLSPYSRWVTPLLAWIWLCFLLIDYATYDLYGFHLNLMIVEMFVTNPSGVGVPTMMLVGAGAVAIGLGAIVYLLNRLSHQTSDKFQFTISGLLLLLIPGLAANSVIHIWAHHYDREEITRVDSLFPLYFPITSHRNGPRISSWCPSVFPPVVGERLDVGANSVGIVNYPHAPVVCENQKSPPSILIIVLESWQSESLRPEIMPNLCRLTDTATRFDQHLSGGSTTVPGLFSLLFGLHPSYYDSFKGSPKSNPSLLTETLHDQGYRSRVFTSSYLERFSLRSLFFSRVAAADYHYDASDQAIVDQYLASSEPNDNPTRPRFDFMFLTSSHSPYVYPPEYARFLPLPAVEGGYAFNKFAEATPYKNDYYNSLYYSDALIGKVIADLKRQGRMENTWIVVTGDHAEEFNENGLGHWGHGSNFTRWQTQTPMVVKSPGQTTGKIETRLSLHQDVVPTLMQDALRCSSPTQNYANGTNLFQLPETRGTVFSSYFTKAYLIDGVIVEGFSGRKYAWDDMKQTKPIGDVNKVKVVMDQERLFLR